MTNSLDLLNFSSRTGLNAQMLDYKYRRLSEYFCGSSCLEMGCADGNGLEILLERFQRVVAVDGSLRLLSELRKQFAHDCLECVHSFFEDLNLNEQFETVHLGHVLEHVDDPIAVLEVVKRHLAPQGRVIASVPNANSFHRLLGVEMGLMSTPNEVTPTDRSIGHKRVLFPEEFQQLFVSAGLNVIAKGGLFFKPFSNGQLEKILDSGQFEALFRLGEQFPEHAADIFCVAEF